MATDSAKVLLSSLLSNDIHLIDEIGRLVSENHFLDPTLRGLYRALLSYRSVSGGVLTRAGVEQIVSGLDAGTAALYVEQFDALMVNSYQPSDARYAAQQLRSEREAWLTNELLRDASQIASGEVTTEDGERWAGPSDARRWAMERIAEVDSEMTSDESPAGYVGDESQDIVLTYAGARDADTSDMVQLGIPRLDAVVGGIGRGEFNVIGAESGFGKSHFCVEIAYHNAVERGMHVFYATSETLRNTVRCRLLARHSRNPKFAELREHFGVPNGLDSALIKRGDLGEELEEFFAMVVADFGRMSGRIWLEQSPHGQTLSALDMSMSRASRARKLDLVIDDYLALRSSGKYRFNSPREKFVEMIKQMKHMSVDYDKGTGVPIFTPWQFNRSGIAELQRTGELDLSALAETSEIGNTPDRVFVLTSDSAPRDGRFAPIRVGLIKNRDANPLLGGDMIPVRLDYATSFFEERAGSEAAGAAWVPSGDGILSNLLG